MIVHILHKTDKSYAWPVRALCCTYSKEDWLGNSYRGSIAHTSWIKALGAWGLTPTCDACIFLYMENPDIVKRE